MSGAAYAGRICRARHNLPGAARLTRHGMQCRATVSRTRCGVQRCAAEPGPLRMPGLEWSRISSAAFHTAPHPGHGAAFDALSSREPVSTLGSSPEEIFAARFARKCASATPPGHRVPDAVQRAALRRRAGTVADAGAGTVPDQQCGISYRTASGARRSFRRVVFTRTGLRPGSSPEEIFAARFARKCFSAAPPARRTACPPAPARRRLRAGRAARRYPRRTATRRSRRRRARPRY